MRTADAEITALRKLIEIMEALDRCGHMLDVPGEVARAEARLLIGLWKEAAK